VPQPTTLQRGPEWNAKAVTNEVDKGLERLTNLPGHQATAEIRTVYHLEIYLTQRTRNHTKSRECKCRRQWTRRSPISIYLSISIYIYIYVYIYINRCMCVCLFVCSGITLERLERFRWLYVCVRILCMIYIYFLSPKHHFQQGGWCGRPPSDPPPLPGFTNRCRGNVCADRYRSSNPIVYVVLDHTNMRPFPFRFVNSALQLRCHIMVKYLNFCVSGLSDSRLG
jgi:hypothetical protein